MTRIRGLLFDKDGTLIHFHQTWMPAFRAVLNDIAALVGDDQVPETLLVAAGYDAGEDRALPNTALATGPTDLLLNHWAQFVADTVPSERHNVIQWEQKLGEKLLHEVARHTNPVVEFAPYFSALAANGYHLGIATMDVAVAAEQLLTRHSARHFVDFVAGADSGFGRKPEPGLVHAFGEHNNLHLEAIAVIGDSPHDLEMGRNAKAGLTVGVLTGVSIPEDLAPYADVVLPSIAELPNWLAENAT